MTLSFLRFRSWSGLFSLFSSEISHAADLGADPWARGAGATGAAGHWWADGATGATGRWATGRLRATGGTDRPTRIDTRWSQLGLNPWHGWLAAWRTNRRTDWLGDADRPADRGTDGGGTLRIAGAIGESGTNNQASVERRWTSPCASA